LVTSPRSLGLLGIPERARRLGGTAHFSSPGKPGHGTTVTVELPLASNGAGK